MSEHAKFSPSAASRWLKCPGSVHATAELHATGNEHSVYTASGSVIHAIGELVLTAVFINKESHLPILDQAMKSTWGAYCDLPPDFADERVTSEMIEQVESYLFHCRELIEDDDLIGIESRLSYNDSLFGTADLALVNDKRLVICDLKSGSGNMVNPEDNEQLLTYAGMAISTLNNPPDDIRLVIIQPPDEIQCKTWVTNLKTVKMHMAKVEFAMQSDDFEAGAHCRWCPVRASCSTLHTMAVGAASLDLDGLSPTGWKDALELAVILKPWCESVFARANQLATEAGLKIPGYKLVDKMGRKTWKSEHAAQVELGTMIDSLALDAVRYNDIFNPAKLRTPLQVQKALKGLIDKESIEVLTEVPHRGTILVPASDKRDEVITGIELEIAAERLELFS